MRISDWSSDVCSSDLNDHLDIVAMAPRRWRAPDQDPDGRPAGPERLQQGASEEPVRAGDQYGRGRKRHMALPQLLQAGGVRRGASGIQQPGQAQAGRAGERWVGVVAHRVGEFDRAAAYAGRGSQRPGAPKSVVPGKSVSVRVNLGGRRLIKKNTHIKQ